MLRPNRLLLVLSAVLVLYVLHAVLTSDGPEPGAVSSSQRARVRRQQKPLSDSTNTKPVKHQPHPLATSNQEFDHPDVEVDAAGNFEFVPSKHKQHPIDILVARAKQHVRAIENRINAITDVADAAADYEREFKMKPPRGFDNWYKFTQQAVPRNVAAGSMYPLAHKPFEQFLSLSPKEVRKRIEAGSVKGGHFTLTFVPEGEGDEGTACPEDGSWLPKDWHDRGRGRLKVGGPMGWKWRCNNTITLLAPLLPKFPQEMFSMDPPFTMVFNAHDGPNGMVHRSFQDRAEAMGRSGKVWQDGQLSNIESSMRNTNGWQWACPDNTPLKESAIDVVLNDEQQPSKRSQASAKKFVADFYKSTDICHNPQFRDLHAFALKDERIYNNPLSPVVSVCRTLRNSDLAGIPLDAVYQNPPYLEWEKKTDAKLFWRGSATGISQNKNMPWRQSQRQRLHYFANNKTEGSAPIIVGRSSGPVVEEYPVKQMVAEWFDIGLAGKPHQCSDDDGTCEEVRNEFEWREPVRGNKGLLYKYVIDVDGNGWSSRFRRLLSGNNVVLKSTAFPEWFNDILVPWYHYVPIQTDYSDVFDIMAYFRGAPDGSTAGRDDVAREISKNAMEFVHNHWRVSDMHAYFFLVVLEYWRMFAEDREWASYSA
ncbi:hypothetical protein Q8F55_008911 [Vanrija albida]|uniref:Glycosyl transferase CAP10 domain-containing protein n=1 Tax=Vanrija albida TaxID=181172 RepID=A0ABR3PS63_9TREE